MRPGGNPMQKNTVLFKYTYQIELLLMTAYQPYKNVSSCIQIVKMPLSVLTIDTLWDICASLVRINDTGQVTQKYMISLNCLRWMDRYRMKQHSSRSLSVSQASGEASSQRHTLPKRGCTYSISEAIILNNDQHTENLFD